MQYKATQLKDMQCNILQQKTINSTLLRKVGNTIAPHRIEL